MVYAHVRELTGWRSVFGVIHVFSYLIHIIIKARSKRAKLRRPPLQLSSRAIAHKHIRCNNIARNHCNNYNILYYIADCVRRARAFLLGFGSCACQHNAADGQIMRCYNMIKIIAVMVRYRWNALLSRFALTSSTLFHIVRFASLAADSRYCSSRARRTFHFR